MYVKTILLSTGNVAWTTLLTTSPNIIPATHHRLSGPGPCGLRHRSCPRHWCRYSSHASNSADFGRGCVEKPSFYLWILLMTQNVILPVALRPSETFAEPLIISSSISASAVVLVSSSIQPSMIHIAYACIYVRRKVVMFLIHLKYLKGEITISHIFVPLHNSIIFDNILLSYLRYNVLTFPHYNITLCFLQIILVYHAFLLLNELLSPALPSFHGRCGTPYRRHHNESALSTSLTWSSYLQLIVNASNSKQ